MRWSAKKAMAAQTKQYIEKLAKEIGVQPGTVIAVLVEQYLKEKNGENKNEYKLNS